MSDGLFRRVYDVVKTIPRGKVATYGQVAMMAGNPRAARAVGWALHKNPHPMSVNNRLPADLSQGVVAPQSNAPACSIVAPSLEKNPLANQSLNSSHEGSNPEQENIPCHRVVNRFGGLSDAFAFGGRDAHRRLLEDEGVEVFDYRVDLAKYQV